MKYDTLSSARSSPDTIAHHGSTPSAGHVFKSAGVGAGIGAAVGLATAFFATRPRKGYFDHSDDGLVIVPLLVFCTTAGFLIGAMVGFYR